MKRALVLLAIILALAGCGHTHPEKPGTPSDKASQLREKRDHDLAVMLSTFDRKTLYPSPKDCDWTLWAGEFAATGSAVDLSAVEYAPGEIHRRPLTSGECYPADSHSTTSNDMLAGYVAAKWRSSDLPALARLAAYAEAHDFVMGSPKSAVGDVVMKPSLIGILGRALQALSHGQVMKAYRTTPPGFTHQTSDYARHIDDLEIVIDGEINTSLKAQKLPTTLSLDTTDNELATLKTNAAEMKSYFFDAALAVYTGAYDQALDELMTCADQPSYVRGERPDVYGQIHCLLARDLVLRHYPEAVTQ